MKYFKVLCIFLAFALTISYAATAELEGGESSSLAAKSPEKRGIYGFGYGGHGFGYGGHGYYGGHGHGHIYPSYGYSAIHAAPYIGHGHGYYPYHGHGFYH